LTGSNQAQGSGQASDWHRTLFVERPEVYLPFLQAAEERADAEVATLAALSDEHGVPDNARVLDVACGAGRHATRLARRGFAVTGIDISPLYIELAREGAREAGVDVTWVLGDALDRDDLTGGPFDAFISMFTSIGYEGREADLRLFEGLLTLAAPGAVLVVETGNRDYLVKQFQNETLDLAGDVRVYQKRQLSEDGNALLSDWSFFDAANGALTPTLRLPMEHQLYDADSLAHLLTAAGWRVTGSQGATAAQPGTLGPVSADSKNIWMTARAPA
jgi:SAM-dependent methyltransferase